jgi:hypothetical protein
MDDILGRAVADGDLIIKPQKGFNGAVLEIGVKKGKSLWYLDYGQLKHCTVGSCYLIKNPNEKELEIKSKILEAMNHKSTIKTGNYGQ